MSIIVNYYESALAKAQELFPSLSYEEANEIASDATQNAWNRLKLNLTAKVAGALREDQKERNPTVMTADGVEHEDTVSLS